MRPSPPPTAILCVRLMTFQVPPRPDGTSGAEREGGGGAADGDRQPAPDKEEEALVTKLRETLARSLADVRKGAE